MKIIGSFLIIISSIIASYIYEKQQKEKIESLKNLDKFIVYMKQQIEYFNYPLDIIYSKFNNKNIVSLTVQPNFESELNKDIKDCFSQLGKGFKSEQIKSLEYLHSKINIKLLDLEKSYIEKVRVFRALSLFIGCCTAILLV